MPDEDISLDWESIILKLAVLLFSYVLVVVLTIAPRAAGASTKKAISKDSYKDSSVRDS